MRPTSRHPYEPARQLFSLLDIRFFEKLFEMPIFIYAAVAARGGTWMAGMDRINVCAALFLIAVLSLTLTPVLSPYRIAADSQFELAKQAWSANGRQQPGAYAGGLEALDYLRFDAGRYGRQRLAELAELPAPAGGAELRKAARDKLAQADRSDGCG